MLFVLPDDDVAERVISEIRRHIPTVPDSPVFSRVYRWHEGECLSYGGMIRDMPRIKQTSLQNVRGLYLCGDYMHLPHYQLCHAQRGQRRRGVRVFPLTTRIRLARST